VSGGKATHASEYPQERSIAVVLTSLQHSLYVDIAILTSWTRVQKQKT
jgi:hypothetical protein